MVRPPLQRVSIGPVIGGDDAVAGRLSVFAPEVQPLAMAADRHARHVRRGDARLFQHVPYDAAVGLPHLLHVPLDKAGLGREHSRVPARHADLAAPRVVQGGLRGGAAIIQAHEVLHRPFPLVHHSINNLSRPRGFVNCHFIGRRAWRFPCPGSDKTAPAAGRPPAHGEPAASPASSAAPGNPPRTFPRRFGDWTRPRPPWAV